jgi:maleate isomerase
MDNNVRRIGILAPPGNVALERELAPFLPPNIVSNHGRLSRPDSSISRESLLAMANSVDQAAHDLAQAYPEVIVYGCTSGSFLEGMGKEAKLASRITQRTGIPAVTTSTAVVEALRAVGARKVFMVTPYPDNVNEHELEFMAHYGFEVVALESFRCGSSEEIRGVSSDDVAKLVLSHPEAIAACDTIFLSCTNMLSMDRVGLIEAWTGKPVITSNQASLWAALVRMRVPTDAVNCGRLFRSQSATGQETQAAAE